MKFLIVLLFFTLIGHANELENSSCISLFHDENLPVLSMNRIPEKYRELIEGLEGVDAIIAKIQKSNEPPIENFNEVLYAALPSLLLALNIIQKGTGGLDGIRFVAHYLQLILKHQDDSNIVNKIHEDFQKRYQEIKKIKSKKTDSEKLSFVYELKNQYDNKVIRFIQNIISPQIICKAKAGEISTSALLSISTSLGLAYCLNSYGKQWLELITGFNVGAIALGASFKYRSSQFVDENAGRTRTHWNKSFEQRGDSYFNEPFDYTTFITDHNSSSTEQTSVGLEGVLLRSFLYSYFPLPRLRLNKKILLQSLFDFQSLQMYGFEEKWYRR